MRCATSGRAACAPGSTCARSVACDTEAVFSLRDPLPGLYEIALLPYLAVKRGL